MISLFIENAENLYKEQTNVVSSVEDDDGLVWRVSVGTCINHPKKETSYLCSKHQVYMCEDCLRCRDPGGHCKFRSACLIRLLEKEEKSEDSPGSSVLSQK